MRKLAQKKVDTIRDEVLTELEGGIEMMPTSQAIEFLEGLIEDVTNLKHVEEDKRASARAEVACTCGERGRRGLHTRACAKTKAVK